jgi:hypothetical protein
MINSKERFKPAKPIFTHRMTDVSVIEARSSVLRRLRSLQLIALVVFAVASPAMALNDTGGANPLVRDLQSHSSWPKARVDDVDTIQHITNAFISSISAPAGGKLDRQRLNSLFLPSGRIELLAGSKTGSSDVVFVTPDEYAGLSDASTAKDGLIDRVISVHLHHFDALAQEFVTYESLAHLGDSKPFARGIKSLELLNRNERWYIVSATWERKSPSTPLPGNLLQSHSDSTP